MTYLLPNLMKDTKMHSLIEMLRYKRPEGSLEQKEFCKRFLEPVFGLPDAHGNYTLIIGDEPNVSFMAHHDTVHWQGGMQTPYVVDDAVYISEDCLGADCTTGIYIMLNMIELGIPGVYVVHAAEEIGCIGSSQLVEDNPIWLDSVDIAISFDRFGTKSIITHQMGRRTCSDAFANSLADELGMGHKPDTKGSYTDSNEYRGVIAECTNLSVGYYNQHSAKECQDLQYLDRLIEALANVDWNNLVVERKPEFVFGGWGKESSFVEEVDDLYDFVRQHPQFIADYLESFGISKEDLEEEMFMGRYGMNYAH